MHVFEANLLVEDFLVIEKIKGKFKSIIFSDRARTVRAKRTRNSDTETGVPRKARQPSRRTSIRNPGSLAILLSFLNPVHSEFISPAQLRNLIS